MKKLKVDGIVVVIVFLSGRLFWINKEFNVFDVFVVVWLFGLEGEGVVDVLLIDLKGNI